MEIFQVFAIVSSIIVCLLLIFLVLIQSGKGGGMGLFGGAGSNTAFGASAMDVVSKATWWLAAAFFGFSILAAVAFSETAPGVDGLNDAEPGLGEDNYLEVDENRKAKESSC